MALPTLVELQKKQLEEFWKEQKVVLDHRELFQFQECIKLQSRILTNFFGISLKIKEEERKVVKKKLEEVVTKAKKGRDGQEEINPVESGKVIEYEDILPGENSHRNVDFTSVDEDMDEFGLESSTVYDDNNYNQDR